MGKDVSRADLASTEWFVKHWLTVEIETTILALVVIGIIVERRKVLDMVT